MAEVDPVAAESSARTQDPVGERIIDEDDFGEPERAMEADVTGEPEGLFSPVTGMGWEQYLAERLDAELVRAASSEQDLTLVIVRIAGLLHTDALSKTIADALLQTFRFRDLVFEFGANGFAGILQNVGLDEAMKTAEGVYAGIDSILMETSFEGQITIGITTRTARLLPASRMIEEASSAARKAEEEPSLPIVAFRANPEKYRDFIVNN
jgi:PleD family two-component response regulator